MSRTARLLVAASLLTALSQPAFAQAGSALDLTPAQAEGPYYPARRPTDADWDLTRVGKTGHTAKGEVILIKGQVLDPSGKPISGARVELWQADAQGIYMHPTDPRTRQRDRSFQFYGETQADARGAFTFRTVMPGAYGGRPRHVHVKVTPPKGETLTTQYYFKDGVSPRRDGILRMLGASVQRVTLVLSRPANDGSREAPMTVVVKSGDDRG